MSRKHNAQHPERARSRYPERLQKRGLSKAPTLEGLDVLRARQAARIRKFGSPFPVRGQEEEEVLAA